LVCLGLEGNLVALSNNTEAKYSMPTGSHIFHPLAFESHGPQNTSVISFIKELRHRISQRSGDNCETQFPFQWLSVIMQRYNAVLYSESFLAASVTTPLIGFNFAFNPRDLYYLMVKIISSSSSSSTSSSSSSNESKYSLHT